MTISNTSNFKKVYVGSGTSTFAYDWEIADEDELLVQQLTIATGVVTTLTITTDYTVTGVGNANGGNVVLTAGSFPSGLSSDYKLVINSDVDITQTTDYVENDPFPAETHEAALDRLTKISKQLKEQIDRAILQNIDATSSITFPSGSADKLIGWDSAGTGLENKTPADLSSAFNITLGASDADKIVKVNAAGDGYEVEQISEQTDETIVAGDAILFSDASDSNKTKKDTVQGILDLVPDLDINAKTDTVITASDEVVFGDVTDSNNLKKDTVQGILDLVTGTQVKIGTFSRDLSLGAGTQDVTGVGFTPKAVVLLSVVAGSAAASWGLSVQSSDFCIYDFHNNTSDTYDALSSQSISAYQNSAGPIQTYGQISAFSSGQFTVTYTIAGSPSGTLTVYYLAIG